ncbi:MAG: hypothetical protein IN804_00935 [Cutibacterium sp.]|jgi:hypothetical protein|nr:hypothetical protein [Cutibacterium sp.]
MATLTWPEYLIPSKTTWGLQSNTESFTSPLSRATQTVERPGARWKATLELPSMREIDRGVLEAFLASLSGQAGRFFLWPHQRPAAAVTRTVGSPLAITVNGDVPVNNMKLLHTRGWPVSALVMRAGEFLQVGSEFKMVTADVTSGVDGACSLPIAPPLRRVPVASAPVVIDRPCATMMLANDEYSISVLPGRISDSVVISAVEAF